MTFYRTDNQKKITFSNPNMTYFGPTYNKTACRIIVRHLVYCMLRTYILLHFYKLLQFLTIFSNFWVICWLKTWFWIVRNKPQIFSKCRNSICFKIDFVSSRQFLWVIKYQFNAINISVSLEFLWDWVIASKLFCQNSTRHNWTGTNNCIECNLILKRLDF